ncbi:MAG: hypothetical protein A2017_15910 [Lentisphaerae bacterium GWF2_44_16]|nr:MAG: hypothetical protein A2017_15910 [Lentisphaerae bacterium GWF2_44_16]
MKKNIFIALLILGTAVQLTADGSNVLELTHENIDPQERKLQELAKEQIKKLSSLSTQVVKARLTKNRWIVVAEINGPSVMTPEQADAVQSKLKKSVKEDLLFMAFSRAEAMIGGKGAEEEFNGIASKK